MATDKWFWTVSKMLNSYATKELKNKAKTISYVYVVLSNVMEYQIVTPANSPVNIMILNHLISI